MMQSLSGLEVHPYKGHEHHPERSGNMSKLKFRTLMGYLTAAGLRHDDAKNIANLFLKWLRDCGPEWTNSRWKDLRQWYETYLTGKPVPAPWFSKTKRGTPKGCLGAIFKLRPEKALLALSLNTLLVSDRELESQKQKFRKGLEGNGVTMSPELRQLIRSEFSAAKPKRFHLPKFDGQLRLLDWMDVSNGKSTVPLKGGKSFPLKESGESEAQAIERLARAIQLSWAGVPEATMEFLWDNQLLDWLPDSVIAPGGHTLTLNNLPREAGKIGHIQEPQLKERNVLSPNAVTQVTTEPLGRFWYATLDRLGYDQYGLIYQDVARDCYKNQERGVQWVQTQLGEGVELAGTDLSSATDLLNLDACLEIIHTVWFPHMLENPEYKASVQYFKTLARAPYWDGKDVVSWKQGQPLGLYPSFALLALTNNAIARLACIQAGLSGNEYCALGDDMIIDSRAVSFYKRWIELIGGEINTSKTLTSEKVAEFAGRVIFPDASYPKATKFYPEGVSDDNFMEFMNSVGPSGRRLLRPRQRKMWDIFRFIPGIIVPGPYSNDGFGERLGLRYAWYLCHVMPEDKLPPDHVQELDPGFRQLKLHYTLGLDLDDESLPNPIDELSYQLSDSTVVHSGDPRKFKRGGKTTLQVLEEIASQPNFVTFEEYKTMTLGHDVSGSEQSGLETQPLVD